MSGLVQFGAGNIGRAFIGRKFSQAGIPVTFVDIDTALVHALNQEGKYRVVVKENDRADITETVGPVAAIDARNSEAVVNALVYADYAACAVGARAVEALVPLLAQAPMERKQRDRPPLDFIIAENLPHAAQLFKSRLSLLLGPEPTWSDSIGLVETSIGKMVPIMPAAALAEDPLQLFTEKYDTLIVDARGFLNPVPPLQDILAVDDIAAYVARKLYMHNMSHAACAYLGFKTDPSIEYIWQALEIPAVRAAVTSCLLEASEALALTYPAAFSVADLRVHADDLLKRFGNRALGDTIFRVGRDLKRKLSRDDRLVGACLLAARFGLPYVNIAGAITAAFTFKAADESGRNWPADQLFFKETTRLGIEENFVRTSGLSSDVEPDREVLQTIMIMAKG